MAIAIPAILVSPPLYKKEIHKIALIQANPPHQTVIWTKQVNTLDTLDLWRNLQTKTQILHLCSSQLKQ